MARRNIEGFESGYRFDLLAGGGYHNPPFGPPNSVGGSTVQSGTARNGGYALAMLQNGSNEAVTFPGEVDANGIPQYNSSTYGKFFWRAYVRWAQWSGGGSRNWARFTHPGVSDFAFLNMDGGGVLRLLDEFSIVRITSGALNLDQWYRIELMYDSTIAGNTQTQFELRIDGSTVGTYGPVPATQYFLRTWALRTLVAADPMAYYVDDVAYDDTDWCGEGAIIPVMPQCPGNYSSWIRGTGLTGAEVNNIPLDGDTSYWAIDATDPVGQRSYRLETPTLRGVTANPIAVRSTSFTRHTFGGSGVPPIFVRSRGSDHVIPENTTFIGGYYWQGKVYNVEPTGGSAWTLQDLADLEIGVGSFANQRDWRCTSLFVEVEVPTKGLVSGSPGSCGLGGGVSLLPLLGAG